MGDPEKGDKAPADEDISTVSTPAITAEEKPVIEKSEAIPNPGKGVLYLSVVGGTPWLT